MACREGRAIAAYRQFRAHSVEAGRTQPVARVLQVIEPARMLAMDEGRFEQTAFLELAKVLRPRATDNSKKEAEAMFGDALKKYQAINDAWGIA